LFIRLTTTLLHRCIKIGSVTYLSYILWRLFILSSLTLKEIGSRLTRAVGLVVRPLCVYGSEEIPARAVPVSSISPCIARAIFTTATSGEAPPIYVGGDTIRGCCPGGVSWLGFKDFPPWVKYFVSTGSKDFAHGAAEYLKASPEIAEKSIKAIGKVTPLGKYIVIQACEDILGEDPGVKSVVCFGIGEQIRNLCSLIYFRKTDTFHSVLTPFGPACATFVTYPAGMAENAPKDSAFIGPTDPTVNSWFPTNHLAIGIPIHMARAMSADLEESFMGKKRPVL